MTILANDSTDQRGHKAVALVASGALEHPVYLDDTRTQRLVPSCSTEGAFYVTSPTSCTCPDTKYRKVVCKHSIALRVQRVLERAESENQQTLEQVAA